MGRPPPAGTGRASAAAAESAFWDCRLSRPEMIGGAACAAMVAALHLDPVRNSMVGTLMLPVLALVSWLTPVTGFFYIACSQFLPFPEGTVMNPAQVGFATWLVVLLLGYRRLRLKRLRRLLLVFPFLIWFMLTTGEFVFAPSSEYMKALGFAVIGCQLASEARGRYMKCLLGLCAGSLMVTTTFWASMAGLPVTVSTWGQARAGMQRMGSVRADAVMVWPAILFAMAGLLGIATASVRSPRPAKERMWLLPVGVACSFSAIPPLIATMTTGGYGGLVALCAAYLWLLVVCFGRGEFAGKVGRRLLRHAFLSLMVVVVVLGVDLFGVETRIRAMLEYQQEVTEERGFAASRDDVWRVSLRTIAKYPIFGVRFHGAEEEVPHEYRERGWYLSHNVFLDYGRSSGVPGMTLFALFFFWPFGAMLRRKRRQKYFPFMLLHVAFLVFFMGLSFQFYKTFWAGWMLMAAAVVEPPPRRDTGVGRPVGGTGRARRDASTRHGGGAA